MKKILIALSALASIAGSASAADLAARPYEKAPSMIAASYDWSGFYMGINGGGGWSNKCWDINQNFGVPVNPPFREGCHNATGGTVGGQLGYRVQSAAWVFGLEAQGNWADFRASKPAYFSERRPTIVRRCRRSACLPARSAIPGTRSCCM